MGLIKFLAAKINELSGTQKNTLHLCTASRQRQRGQDQLLARRNPLQSHLFTIATQITVALLLCGFFSLPANTAQAAAQMPTVARPAAQMPHFALPAAHGSGVIDSKSYRGQTILINFFATWCPPCRKEIPSLIELQKKYGPQGLAIIGISLDESGSAQVARFAEKMGITYPVLMSDPQTLKAFGEITAIPTSFLFNPQGTLVKRYEGYTDQHTLEKELRKILP